MRKRKTGILLLFIIIIIGIGIYVGGTSFVKNIGEPAQATERSEHEFATLLEKKNIYVEPQNVKMTCDQIEGMLRDVQSSEIVEQYKAYLEDKDKVTMNAMDLVELHYYSLSPYERARFLRKTSGQKITVEVGDEGSTVLISYNTTK